MPTETHVSGSKQSVGYGLPICTGKVHSTQSVSYNFHGNLRGSTNITRKCLL
jgi:hypothetical protein